MADIAKVKRNIQRMIDQNAPESDIDAYVASEGTTPEALRGEAPTGETKEQAVPWYTPITSAPGDAWDAAKGVYETVRHPIQTMEGMGRMLEGGLQYMPQIPGMKTLNNALGVPPPTPEQLQSMQESKALVGNAASQIADNFSTPTRAWNTIATNPVDTALMFAPGLGQAGKMAQANNLSKTARVLNGAETLLDPAKPFDALQRMGGKVPEGQTRLSAEILRKTLPKDLSAMDKLGPDAMLLDASPSMTGLARGVAANVGPGADSMIEALLRREQGRSPRLQDGAKKIFGHGRDPVAFKAMIDKNTQKQAGSIYKKATQNPAEFRDAALENELGRKLTLPAKRLSGPARDRNLEWMNQVDDAMAAETPRDAIARLHDLRKRLDPYIEFNSTMNSAEKADRRVAKKVRDVVDNVLKTKVDKFKDGDALYSTWAKKKDDFDFGFESLKGGEGAMFPETFTKSLKGKTGTYVKQGQASRIANAMGTQSNDLSAIKKMLGGDGDFNRAKLSQTFGPTKVDEAISMVDSEAAMSQNFADIARNSKTAQSLVAQDMIKDIKPYKVDSGVTALGLASKVPVAAFNRLMGKYSGKVSASTSDALAKALVGNKTTVQELLRSLDKTGKVPLVDKTLVRALLFSGGLQSSQAE